MGHFPLQRLHHNNNNNITTVWKGNGADA
jgi:hypothetical protein